ncbi:hypothetical protein B0J18DRAFT_294680 [Chaetomium sp. MPI-SDFR-AT-0129]|nr:hypothetical protein B0J18DRAFT_294680 [Chaetomium sp. MPI-SDFR-AT-0129]
MSLEGFPTLQPAFTIKSGGATERFRIGNSSVGGGLVAIPFYNGVIESVPDFTPKFKFNISNGIDYVTVDEDGKYGRFNVKAVLTDDEGRNLVLSIDAITELHPDVVAIIEGTPDAKSAPFGYCVEQLKFWVGDEVYKPLESMYFVSSQRFTVAEDGTAGAELRVSRVVSGI